MRGRTRRVFAVVFAVLLAVSIPVGFVYIGYEEASPVEGVSAYESVDWTYTGHSNSVREVAVDESTGTVYSAAQDDEVHAIDASDGTQQWTYTGHSDIVYDVAVDESTGTVYSGSHDDEVHAINAYTITSSISGQVTNQNGDPVENATVEAWGYSAPTVATAKDDLDDLSDPIPTEFETQLDEGFQLEGPSGHFADLESDYAAIFSAGDWPTGLTFDNPDLSPKWRSITPGQDLVLTSWDPTDPRSGGIDEDLPGQTTDTPVVVEQVDGSGDTTDRQVYNLTQEYSTASATWNPLDIYKTHNYRRIALSTGIYRIYAQGASEAAYQIKVGEPKPSIDDALEADDGGLTNQSQSTADKLSSGDLVRYSVTTDADGAYQVDVDASLKLVHLQAYKAPDSLDLDPSTLELSDLRNVSAEETYNGSYILPSQVRTAEPPATGVDLEVREFDIPTYSSLDQYTNLTDWLDDYISDLNYTELGSALQDRLDDLNRDKLEDLNQKLEQLVAQNDDLREKYRELLQETTGDDDVVLDINESDASDEELRNRIAALEETIDGLRESIESGDGELEKGNETISWTKPFNTDLNPEDVLVLVHYTNGSTETLTTDSEYVRVDSSIVPGMDDAVVIEDFPLGDAAGAGIEVIVANEEGVGSDRRQVTNPAFDGQIPGLDSIAFSSLNPGPSESVSMELNPDDDTTIQNVTEVTVYGPDGSSIPANVTDRNTAEFETNGRGQYEIRTKFQDADGNNFTVVQRLKAGEVGTNVPPGIRADETPYGTIAIVGDGLEDGSVDVEEGGARIRLVAQVPSAEEIPGELHAYTETLSLLDDHRTQVSIVEGDQQSSVGKHVQTTVHEPALDTSSEGLTNFEPLFYRNDEPLPKGSSSTGIVELNESQTTIETYTDSNGQVEIRSIENPSIRQWARYQVDSLEFDLPVVGTISIPIPLP